MKVIPYAFVAITALLLASPTLAGDKMVTLRVDNMTCATCAPTVRKSLERVAGVTKAEVSGNRHTATVTFDDTKTTVEALISATTNAGYPSRLAN